MRASFSWPFLRDAFNCAVLSLALCTAAYQAEIFRGALLAVPPGQVEAARACGMSGLLMFRRIIFPIAMRHALPAYSTEMISMVKATALVSLVTLWDVMSVALKIRNDTLVTYLPLILAGAIYFVVNYIIGAASLRSSGASRRICGPGRAEGSEHARRDARAHRRENAQELWPARSPEGDFACRQRWRRHLDPRLVGLGQEHLSALHQSPGDAGLGRRDGRRRNDQDAPPPRRRAEPADRRQVDRIRSELGMVFQSFNFWSHLTVLENLIEAPVHVQKRPRAECVEEARALLAKVGMSDKWTIIPRISRAGSSSAPRSRARSPCGRK